MGFRFAVLGPTRAWRDDVELQLGSPQQRATLTTLLLREGGPVALDELVDTIWGEADAPRTAVGTLRSYVSRLRRVIGADVIDSTGGGYALRTPPGTLDLMLFRERIERAQTAHRDHEPALAATLFRDALALWRGAPLAGAHGVTADARRTLLTQMRLTAVESRFAVELELGRHVELIAELSAQVAEQPMRERLRELHMLALYRSGRQADALASFQQGRELLAEEIGVDPGPALRRIHQRILSADPALLEPSPRVPRYGSAPAPRLIPAQLPPFSPDFTGRGRLLKEVTGRLTVPDGMPVVGLVGLAGVGKTALALRAAHAVRPAFPDGQVYADLGAAGDRPADPSAVLAAFLRSYGFGDRAIPDAAGERAALWRTTLAGRRVLVVLDDARDSDQIRDLFPGTPGSAVLVTSRSRMPELPGVHWCKADVLDPEEALDLLSRVAGPDRVRAEPAAARRLVAACSGIPLSIRLAGLRVAARPGWTMAAVERQLNAEANQLTLTARHPDCRAHDAPLMPGYRRLDAAQARAFRLVALFEGTGIVLRAAAEILQLPLARTERLLESLVDVHLIETDRPGRYTYHEHVKSFARRRAVEEDGVPACRAAIGRLVTMNTRKTNAPETDATDAGTRAALLLLSHSMGAGAPDHPPTR
ncbi:winged helix-turn-helix domain-containing protein [Streptomyces sp. GMY02]|uniref:AfsR/SARP family transcriptional regulator n=1 Tax=Streptomyces sp. GMY02 TaxID=1333528 RepID=UPI001C2C3598|nr:BTAD domain-containing putative transcriptional regulator [Streptomyces sp. GMY02]QXE34553.1 winged helix-turn-helix domain-containing protein [Streptomyces sp. GMY02]